MPITIDTAPTAEMLARVTRDWTGYAKEPVRVEAIGGALYGFGSEIACLRIYAKYAGKGRAAYSENLGTWYYTLELRFSGH